MTEEIIIKANVRNLGSAESRRLRKSGFLPATVRNGKDISYVAIDQKEFDKKYFDGSVFITPLSLEIDGKKVTIIANDVDIHPVSDRPIHVDFNQINKGQEVRARVKIEFTGQDRSTALKRGGFLHINERMVDVICKNIDFIPEKIDVDISEFVVGDKIRSNNISLQENVQLKRKGEFLIASILGRGASKTEEDESSDSEDQEAESTEESDKKE
jgi:large subunit ribosomal protein L25